MFSMNDFYEKYPLRQLELSTKKIFEYRYYKNPDAAATLVLLTGGIGLSDLFYLHFERFAKRFSVMTFDYQTAFSDNAEFADAVAELVHHHNVKVWLVGQSLGGIVAQIITKRHPDIVDGLILSNTCSLSKDMDQEAYDHVMKMVNDSRQSKKILKFIPFGIYKRLIKKMVMKKMNSGFTKQQKNLMEGLCDAMFKLLTKPYEYHMLDFMCDAENHLGMTADDFAFLSARVLLLLSEDDNTFNRPSKDALIRIMPNPVVVTDITGGHLALLVKLEKYADTVEKFILKCVLRRGA